MTATQPGAPVLDWDATIELLANAQVYWVCTVRAQGRPHAVPVWGLWWRNSFVFSAARDSLKVRNLRRLPAVVVHVDSGQDVAIVDGNGAEVTDRADLGELGPLFTDKYGRGIGVEYDFVSDAPTMMAVIAVRAEVVQSWHAGLGFVATKWTIDEFGVPHVRKVVTERDLEQAGA
jgi:hypothetical protein